ncbi:MAG: M81 family metallopeptidase [Chloroflexi bacterium]|nr:M81 family metallopeptidase [Chloroflexota bacterium]
MRIALLGMAHETNTFSLVPATYREFKGTGFVRGQELVDEYRDSFHTNAGFLQAEDDFGREVVPLLYAHAGPIGTITRDAFDRIVGEMLRLLKDQGPCNGVFLAQHGAAVSQPASDVFQQVQGCVRGLHNIPGQRSEGCVPGKAGSEPP